MQINRLMCGLRSGRLAGSLDHSLEQLSRPDADSVSVPGLRWLWLDGVFSAISATFYAGFLPLFALAFGANNAQVGQLTAVASLLALLALFPGARAVATLGHRKQIILWSGGGIGRLCLLLWACLPFLVHDPAVAISAIIAINGINAFMGNFGNPGWTAMVADIVPAQIRGRYFSHRNLAVTLITLPIAPLAGWLIKVGAHEGFPGAPFAGYQFVFFLAFAIGMASTLSYAHIDDAADPGPDRSHRSLLQMAQTIGRNRGFLAFVASTFIWNIGIQVAGPFFNVYLVGPLGGSASTVGLLATVQGVTALLSQRWIGRLTDRKGNISMMTVTGLAIPLLPLGWAFVTAPWQITIINLVAGVLWTGYNLASFNLLLDLAPKDARPDAAAFYQFVIAIGAVFAPLLGGYLADAFGYKLVFVLSAAGRLAGALTFIWWVAWPARRGARMATDRSHVI